MSRVVGLPQSPTASALVDLLALVGSGEPPAIRWSEQIQPQPLRRARVDRGIGHLTPECLQYREDLQWLWKGDREIPKTPLEGELFVAMAFAGCSTGAGPRPPRMPKPDRTNLEKAIEDAGNGLLWRDDRQIVQGLSIVHAWGPSVTPFVSLEVWQLEGAA